MERVVRQNLDKDKLVDLCSKQWNTYDGLERTLEKGNFEMIRISGKINKIQGQLPDNKRTNEVRNIVPEKRESMKEKLAHYRNTIADKQEHKQEKTEKQHDDAR